MNHGMKLLTFPVRDVDRAKQIFGGLLGAEPYADAPYYVGYRIGDLEIGLVPNGQDQGMTAPIPYWEVDDIKQTLQTLLDAGAQAHQDVRDVGGGKLVATIRDADGNTIGLMQSS